MVALVVGHHAEGLTLQNLSVLLECDLTEPFDDTYGRGSGWSVKAGRKEEV
jgi:hypothetical protein